MSLALRQSCRRVGHELISTGLPKDSAGYDISRLLVGSEGTLAVITAVRVHLQPELAAGRVTALVGVTSLAQALELVAAAAPPRETGLGCRVLRQHGHAPGL